MIAEVAAGGGAGAAPDPESRPYPRMVSSSQLMYSCDKQLEFHRGRLPRRTRSAALLYGSVMHGGLEAFHRTRDVGLALEAARRTLDVELASCMSCRHPHAFDATRREPLPLVRQPDLCENVRRGPDGADKRCRCERYADPVIVWDEAPRKRKDGKPYKGDGGKVMSAEQAMEFAAVHIEVWSRRFQHYKPIAVESDIEVEMSRPAGWRVLCKLDLIVDVDGEMGIVDYKSAAEEWDAKKVESRAPQAYLYMGAFERHYGYAPAWFDFHVFVKGKADIQVVRLEFDVDEIDRYLELFVRPKIAQIISFEEDGRNLYIPRTDGWWHSAKFCDWWDRCPLGAAAQKEIRDGRVVSARPVGGAS